VSILAKSANGGEKKKRKKGRKKDDGKASVSKINNADLLYFF